MSRSRPAFRRARRARGRFIPRVLDVMLAAALLAAVALVAARASLSPAERLFGNAAVSDGDSLRLAGNRVRLEGIDAPELGQSCAGPDGAYPCGRQARDVLVRLIGNGPVTCESRRRDRYERLLARCVAGEQDLNRSMVELGWALAYGDYEDAEARARAAKRGLWSGTFDDPRAWRRLHGGLAEAEHDGLSQVIDWFGGLLRGRGFYRQADGEDDEAL